jgi:non-specific serine/threonine protein kinase
VGKTRVALAVAEDVADAFADGVVFVALAPIRDPDLIPSAVAQALGVHEVGQQTLIERIAVAIGQRRMLLVLDNFEHVTTAAPLATDLLEACPRLTVLATSRIVLHLTGEHVVLVPPLGLADPQHLPPLTQSLGIESIRLFVERAREARADFALTEGNAPAIAAVCARLDGLPLAIELAAARVRVLSPAALLAQLEQRLRLLTGGPRDAPVRQQTMRDTIAWSYDLLEPEVQRSFERLAVFVGGWTLEAADAVCGPDGNAIERLSTLVDASLVRQTEVADVSVRFDMLETIREFAQEQLERSGGSDDIRQRYAAFFLSMAERFRHLMEHTSDWSMFAQLDRERENVRSALGWAVAEGHAELALRIASCMFSYWAHRNLAEGRRWLEAALGVPGAAADGARVRALHDAAELAAWAGDAERADDLFQEALAAYQAREDVAGLAELEAAYAGYIYDYVDPARAVRMWEAALATFRMLGDQGQIARIVNNLGVAAIIAGDADTAEPLFEECLALVEAHGLRPSHRMRAQSNLGWVARVRGDGLLAWQRTREALVIIQRYGSAREIGGTFKELGCAALLLHQGDAAARLFGIGGRLQSEYGWALTNDEVLDFQRYIDAGRAQVGDDAWASGLDEGRAMSTEAAFDYALSLDPVAALVPAADPSPLLSRRETEVLRLLADGKSNQEIAAALFISPHTAAHHVGSILNKLGLDSRAAAAAYAVRHDLV